MVYFPLYLETYSSGLLDEKLESLRSLLDPCMMCPRQCMADRAGGSPGYCRAPHSLCIASVSPHFGEEKPLVGTNGSGTIFLSHCNLRCVFCQNHDISIYGGGTTCSSGDLSRMMLDLQQLGCHNINFVTPTHYVAQIVQALPRAIDGGLSVPLVYNTSGYDSVEVIRLLEGIFDIYMPDIKFLDAGVSAKYCQASNYPVIVSEAVKEMHRQVGDLLIGEDGIARRGILFRHLVMPGLSTDTAKVLDFIAGEISLRSYVNIMAQYHPCHRALDFPEIYRGPTRTEYEGALEHAKSIGLIRASRY